MLVKRNLVAIAAFVSVLFAGASIAETELIEICAKSESDCVESQKAASKPKSGCYKKPNPEEYCYKWNPNGRNTDNVLETLILDPVFEDAYITRLREVTQSLRDEELNATLSPVTSYTPIKSEVRNNLIAPAN